MPIYSEDFYDALHGQIFDAAKTQIASGKLANPITLRPFFENAEPIDADLSVPQYLGRLAANACTTINARSYGQTIYDLAARRELILIGEEVAEAAYSSPVDFPVDDQIDAGTVKGRAPASVAELYAFFVEVRLNGKQS